MNVRRLALVTHRWIGLGTSVVLAVVGVTGAVMVWGGNSWLHKLAGRFHETLALGRVGGWIVLIATGGAVVLQFSGVFLWWKRTSVAPRTAPGWRGTLFNFHQAAGAVGLWIMLALAATAIGMSLTGPGALRRKVVGLHTARELSGPIKALYAMGSLGFLIQGVTGVMMWWRPGSRR